ncbi:hypothetical protein JCM10213_000773 [Rhodosporidiobolus nylandii]
MLTHKRTASQLLYGRRRSTQALLLVAFLALQLVLVREYSSGRLFSLSSSVTLSPFAPAASPKPVGHTPTSLDFANSPVSISRPSLSQFTLDPQRLSKRPTIAIITATRDAHAPFLRETAASLFGQSVQDFLWLVVDDGTANDEAREVLAELERDGRVRVLRNEEPRGMASSRNRALEVLLAMREVKRPKYVAMLDDDDIYELTALEKVISMLESNEEWDIGGFQVVRFGREKELVLHGLHSGAKELLKGNLIPDAAVVTTRALLDSTCRFDETDLVEGGESHAFWLCLARAGHWGGTVPEPLYWHRTKPSTLRRRELASSPTLRLLLQQQHAALSTSGALPDRLARPAAQLESVRWSFPAVSNALAVPEKGEKTLLLVLPSFTNDIIGQTALRQAQVLAEKGYRVTVVATQYAPSAGGLDLRPMFLQWTHDVHILPAYVRANDAPAYFVNLARSRGVSEVLFSKDRWTYEMLPALVEQLPLVKFIDYLHTGDSTFLTLSSISQRFLSRTLVASSGLRSSLLTLSASPLSVAVLPPGHDTATFVPVAQKTRTFAKRQLLSATPRTSVILVSAPALDAVHRANLLPAIAASLRERGHRDFLFVLLAGDAPPSSSSALLTLATASNVSSHLHLISTPVSHPSSYLAASSLFLRLSSSPEESVLLAEAMAMGLPVVSTASQGASDQLGAQRLDGARGGILVQQEGDEEKVAEAFADEIAVLLDHPKLARYISRRARQIALETMDWRTTQATLEEELAKAELPSQGFSASISSPSSSPAASGLLINPAVHYALQTVLTENHDETDFSVSQRALKASPRQGVGKELQDRCGETSEDMGKWISSLEAPRSCAGGELDIQTLQRSAKFQCGAWCIFDLTTSAFTGWSYNGECFDVMTEGSWCEAWTASRPSVNLAKE